MTGKHVIEIYMFLVLFILIAIPLIFIIDYILKKAKQRDYQQKNNNDDKLEYVMFCPECGKENDDDARFCAYCGNAVDIDTRTTPSVQPERVITSKHPLAHSIFKYSGFWKRFIAILIDGVILFIPNYIILLKARQFTNSSDEYLVLTVILQSFLTLGYQVGFVTSSTQATIGKMVLGIIVTDINGKRITVGRATAREISKIFSSLILMIGFMMAGWTSKKQALHDLIADCLVLDKN